MLYYNSNIIFIYAKGNITCKHYKINEHSRNTLGAFSVTFDFSLTTSACGNPHYKLATDYFERALL